MINTRTLAVFAALLVVGGLTAQVGAVPGVTAQQESPSDQAATTGVTVDSLAAPQSVAPNSTADVAATVTNNENATVTESVEFRFDGAVVDRTLVTLEPNETTTVEFSADTTGVKPGDYRHGVFTSDDGQVAAVTVSESYTLDSIDAPTNASAGDNITVDATVTNPNDFSTNQTVEFRLGGEPLASESVSLDANESTDVTFTVDTTGVEPDTYVHSVFTRDDGTFAEITIEPAIDVPDDSDENETEDETEETTEDVTEEPTNETEDTTENETEQPIENETEEPPANETDETTDETTDNETEEPTEGETEEPLANETEETTEEQTEGGTEEPPATETDETTDETTDNETEESTGDETEEPTEGETDETTDETADDETEEDNATDETDETTEEAATTEG